MKLKIREESFTVTANIDERIRSPKSKLVVHQPDINSTRFIPKTKNKVITKDSYWKIQPKIGGIVLSERKSNRIHKTTTTDGVSIHPRKNNGVLKTNNTDGIVLKKQTSTAVYKHLKVIDLFSPDVVPNALMWTSDYEDLYDGIDASCLIFSFGDGINNFSFLSNSEQITGINTPIELEISWTNYSYKDNFDYNSVIDPIVVWKVWKGSSEYDPIGTDTLLPEGSPVTITVVNGDWITFTGNSVGPSPVNQPQIRAYTIKNKSNGNSVLANFTIGSYVMF
jgi:hypothetical protein